MENKPQQEDLTGPQTQPLTLTSDQFRIDSIRPGSSLVAGDVVVFNVEGELCATQAKCTHKQGPLSEGKLEGSTVTCPWHGAQFNVCTGAVLRGPAMNPLKTYRVIVEGEIGRLEEMSDGDEPQDTSLR